MEQWDINPNLPFLRPLTNSRRGKRRLSCSPGSRSTHSSPRLSSTSPTQSKNLISIPILIELCIYPDEDYAYQTMKILLSSRYNYSPNVCDEYGCNVLMYTLRYQRYQLFDYLLNETSLDLDFQSKDRLGNTILHYAVVYGKNDTKIVDTLIERFIKFGINVDGRNTLGFTALLLAMFCGRYNIVLSLLTKTDASPFVRDYIQSINILDYIEIDVKNKAIFETMKNNRQYAQYDLMSRELTRLRIQLYKTLPSQSENSYHTIQHNSSMNFFENVFPQAAQDRSGLSRLSILRMLDNKSYLLDLTRLIEYMNQRYPRLNTLKKLNNFPNQTKSTPSSTKLIFHCDNSKIDVHNIINLFDPDLRPKAITPKVLKAEHAQFLTNAKVPNTFKRLGTKLTVLATLSRSQNANKIIEPIKTTSAK